MKKKWETLDHKSGIQEETGNNPLTAEEKQLRREIDKASDSLNSTDVSRNLTTVSPQLPAGGISAVGVPLVSVHDMPDLAGIPGPDLPKMAIVPFGQPIPAFAESKSSAGHQPQPFIHKPPEPPSHARHRNIDKSMHDLIGRVETSMSDDQDYGRRLSNFEARMNTFEKMVSDRLHLMEMQLHMMMTAGFKNSGSMIAPIETVKPE